MKNKKAFVLGVITIIFFASVANAELNKEVQQVVEGNNNLCFDLYDQLKGEEGNLFLSPYSISTALAMTYAGARGETEKQMSNVLHFTLPQDRLHANYSKLQSNLNSIEEKGDVQLNIANSLWLQKGDPFLDSFLDLNRKYYNPDMYFVDFINAKNKARSEINSWVVEKTHNKIKNLLKPPLPYRDTSLILCNAIYFKGNWLTQFDKAKTTDDDFFLSKDKEIKVPMMSQKSDYRYMDYGLFEGLELPYEGNDLSMIIFLPKQKDGLPKLEENLSVDTLAVWIEQLMHAHKLKVSVMIPKFETVCEFDLANILYRMGMSNAFIEGIADFSGINGRRNLFISKVIHKAFVDVNEEGTEAAAATAVLLTRGGNAFVIFEADHPFLFLIRENNTGNILFIGRIVDPRE